MNYFFVSQRNQSKENQIKKLTAPDNKDYSYIKNNISQNDLIVQYSSKSKSITGIAQAKNKPYADNGTIYVDIDIYSFAEPLPKGVWAEKMREKQNGRKSPVTRYGDINSRYLHKINYDLFNYVLEEAEKNYTNKEIVNKVRSLISSNESKENSSSQRSNSDRQQQKDSKSLKRNELIQKIFFGAPGTGKSFKIDDPEKGYGLKYVDESRKFRTTFHPDYDYAQFVGAYKPKPVGAKTDKTEITYSFVPQVFAKAYAAAWEQYFSGSDALTDKNQVYLVIEEINRGNCAQIFGDIFQLLDRVDEGEGKDFSRYSIDADSDFAEWLKTGSVLKEKSVWTAYEKQVGKGKLMLPPNLNILATMNTSDQSLFPMDSAFKRRFDWEYVPIDYEHPDAGFDIRIDGKLYKWLEFLKVANKNVYDVTKSEDKQMGEFFIRHSVDYKEFRSKVLFYLWDSVYKDEIDNKDAAVFQIETGKFITFQSLFEGDEETQKNLIKKIFSKLGIAEREEANPAQ